MVAAIGNRVEDEVGSDLVAMGPPVAVRRDSNIRRAPSSSGLYDVLDLILDKGIVIDAFVRVSLVGIEILTVDLRVVIASVDTYLRYAEGAERLQIYKRADAKKLPDMVGNGVKTHALKKGAERIKDFVSGDDEDEGNDDEGGEHKKGLAGALTHGVRHMLQKGVGGILHNIKGDSDDDDRDDDRGEEEESDEREPARQSKGGGAARAKAGSRR